MGYSRYVGRVGALAVMLGVGTAVAAPAWADDNASGSDSSASSSSSSDGSSSRPRHGAQADSKRRTPTGGVAKANKGPKKSSGAGLVTAPRPEPERAPTTEQRPVATPVNEPAPANAPQPVIAAVPDFGQTDAVVPQSLSVSLVPKATQAVAQVTARNTVFTLLPTVPSAPAQLESVFAMLGVARRQTGANDAPEAAAAPPAATTTLTVSSWSQLVSDVAKYGGYISLPTAGTSQNNIPATLSDTSWTLKNTQLDAFDDTAFGAYNATQTVFTYSTPYTQNAFVQSQLKNNALALHLTYSASNYTAYLVATSPTDPGTISGGKQLTLGDSIVHPAPIIALVPDGNGNSSLAMPATTDPSWQSSYSVVILPKNIVPVFPGGDITAPKAPTLATSKLTPFSVTVKPTGSTDDVGVVGYNYYRVSTYDYGQGNIQTSIVKVNGSTAATGTTFVDDEAIEPETTYIYTVRAVDAAGHESLDSTALVVTTPAVDTEPPTAPTITAGTITTTTATLVVSGSTDNVGVVSYAIFRDGEQVIEKVAVGETFVDSGLTPGTEYSYTARAYDAADNESDESAAIVVTTLGSTGGGGGGDNGGGGEQQDPLPVPALRASEITDSSVHIELSRAKHDNRVVSYIVYRDGEPIYTITKITDSFIDLNLDSSHIYTYTVRAQDADGHLSEVSRPLRVTIYSKKEWEYIHGDDANPFWEKAWEKFTTYFGWIPLVGDGIAAISMGVDIGQLLTAIVSGKKHEIYDEVFDLLGDGIGFIPIIGIFKNMDKTLADAIEELDNGRVRETAKSIAWHAAELIYDKLVRPRVIEPHLP